MYVAVRILYFARHDPETWDMTSRTSAFTQIGPTRCRDACGPGPRPLFSTDNFNDTNSQFGNLSYMLFMPQISGLFRRCATSVRTWRERVRRIYFACCCRVSHKIRITKKLGHQLISVSLHLLIIRRFDVLKRHRGCLHSRRLSVRVDSIQLCEPVIPVTLS